MERRSFLGALTGLVAFMFGAKPASKPVELAPVNFDDCIEIVGGKMPREVVVEAHVSWWSGYSWPVHVLSEQEMQETIKDVEGCLRSLGLSNICSSATAYGHGEVKHVVAGILRSGPVCDAVNRLADAWDKGPAGHLSWIEAAEEVVHLRDLKAAVQEHIGWLLLDVAAATAGVRLDTVAVKAGPVVVDGTPGGCGSRWSVLPGPGFEILA